MQTSSALEISEGHTTVFMFRTSRFKYLVLTGLSLNSFMNRKFVVRQILTETIP